MRGGRLAELSVSRPCAPRAGECNEGGAESGKDTGPERAGACELFNTGVQLQILHLRNHQAGADEACKADDQPSDEEQQAGALGDGNLLQRKVQYEVLEHKAIEENQDADKGQCPRQGQAGHARKRKGGQEAVQNAGDKVKFFDHAMFSGLLKDLTSIA